MSDCCEEASAPAEDCSCDPATSMDCSSSTDPPPSYEMCVSNTMDASRNSHNHCTKTQNGSAGTHSLDEILYDTAGSQPFLDATQESEQHHHRDDSRSTKYTSGRSYKPSSMTNRPNTRASSPYVYRSPTPERNRHNIFHRLFYSGDNADRNCRILCVVASLSFFFGLMIYAKTHSNYRDPMLHFYRRMRNDLKTQKTMFSVPDFSEGNENIMNTLRRLDKPDDDTIYKRRY